jgi:hypothetical protein
VDTSVLLEMMEEKEPVFHDVVSVPGSAIKMAISSQIQWFVIIFPSKNPKPNSNFRG